MRKLTYAILAVILTTTSLADDSFDDSFSGDEFSDDAFSDDIFSDIETPAASSKWSLTNTFALQSIVNINSEEANAVEELYSGVTSVLATYQPEFSYQPNDTLSFNGEVSLATDGVFWLRPDDAWSDEDIEARQYQFDIKDLTAQYRLNNWQFNAGKQTITLGLADALSVSNVLHAQNLMVPGTTDFDDTVKSAWASVASGSVGSVRIKAGTVLTHEVNDVPLTGIDFDTGMNAQLAMAGLNVEPNELAIKNMGWFTSFSGVTGPLDWQLNAVSQLAHSPSLKLGLVGMAPVPVELIFPRTTTVSAASSYVLGSFLWKLEAAYTDGLTAQQSAGMVPGDMVTYKKASGTAGFDFDHGVIGRLVAEIQYGAVLDYDALALMNTEEQTVQFALMYSKSFLRESLTLNGQLIGFDIDASGGRMQTLSLDYDLSDSLSTMIKLIDYVDGDYVFLNGADDRDRIITEIRYAF